jgi:enoyl-CoA hydratase/carnithine racemase
MSLFQNLKTHVSGFASHLTDRFAKRAIQVADKIADARKDDSVKQLEAQIRRAPNSRLLKAAMKAEAKRRGLRGHERRQFRKNFRAALKVIRDGSGNPILVQRRRIREAQPISAAA